MIRCWQAVLGLVFCATVVTAAEKGKFTWKRPEIGAGAFTEALGMLDRERDEYAENLAILAVNEIARAKASAASLERGRRLLALSMHLAPRNKRALVANYQLDRGMVPQVLESDYDTEVLARLLFTRGQMLKGQGGGENQRLARIFTELAAELDPKNEDAVYASELQRLDHGPVNWESLTDHKQAEDGIHASPPAMDEEGVP